VRPATREAERQFVSMLGSRVFGGGIGSRGGRMELLGLWWRSGGYIAEQRGDGEEIGAVVVLAWVVSADDAFQFVDPQFLTADP
jgi:hypothetical protein